MKRCIRRDMNKRVSSSGYQRIQGDLEVQGNILSPTITNLTAAVAAITATTTTPVKLAAPVAIGGMRSVTLHWAPQYTLSTFSHYEVQVSDDSLSWYSLKTDGTGWGDTLNATTTVTVTTYDHTNIPLVQDAGDLVGQTLYYRVRQVTKDGTTGAWSDPAVAQTRGVQDIVIKDQYSRYIEISSHKGIYADDRQGHVIHDIPNAPILSGMVYGGHAMWLDAPDAIGEIDIDYTDANTARTVTSAATNTTILEHLPTGLTNIKGAIVYIVMWQSLAAAKVAVGTVVNSTVKYGTAYNTIGTYTYLLQQRHVASVVGEYYFVDTFNGLMPVTWDAGIPYLTWNVKTVFSSMLNANDQYFTYAYLHLLGVFV
jgi:hypothetical protein